MNVPWPAWQPSSFPPEQFSSGSSLPLVGSRVATTVVWSML